jgi:hypothetical protein
MAIQQLRSSTANKRPDPVSMVNGQIALNIADTSPGLFFKDAGGTLVKAGPVHVGSNAPNSTPAGSSGNAVGEQWLDTSGGIYASKIWDGSAWQQTTIGAGAIVNANVNASAAIAGSKIQAATTSNAGAVQLTDSTSSTSTTTAATPASVKSAYDLADAAMPKAGGAFTGDVTINAQGDLRFADSDSSNWVAFQAPATVASNVTWTLPATDGANGQALSTNGSGTLSWTNVGTGDVTLTGTQTLTNKTLTDPAIIGTILEDVFTISDGAAFEIDPGNGSVQLITLGASRTPKATNMVAGEAITLMVDDGSAYTLTWSDATFGGSGVVWKTNAGVAPTLNTTGYTVIVLWKVSTQVYGARVGDA